MKKIVIVAFLLSTFSCKSSTSIKIQAPEIDTVAIKKIDSLSTVLAAYKIKNDSLLVWLKTEKNKNFKVKYQIGRIQYRIKICKKNAALKKFFFGWANRFLNE